MDTINPRPSREQVWGESDYDLDRRVKVLGQNLTRDIGNLMDPEERVLAKEDLIASCHEVAQRLLPLGAIYEILVMPQRDWIEATWRATWPMQDEPLEVPVEVYLPEIGGYRVGRYRVEEGDNDGTMAV